MATFVNDLRLTELATGEGSGTWGTTTNTNLELIAESFSFGTEAITTNADTHTTTIADGSTDPGRSIFLKYTGTLDSACTITIGPNTVSKLWFIENATSGSQNIIIKQGSGSTITIPNGQTKAIYSDGAGSGGAMVDAFQDLSIPDLFIDDDLTFTSDSAVITFGADGDTTLTHTDGSGLTLNSTNKLMFNDASQFIQGSSATVLSLGATDEIDLTATLIDINGNADVSGTVTATGTSVFASLDISGDIDVDGTTNLDVVDIDGAVDMASTLTVGGATSISVTDTSDALTVISTDAGAGISPISVLYRNSSSPANNDQLGRLKFRGRNDNSQDVEYAEFLAQILDVSDGAENGRAAINVMTAGTSQSRIDMRATETSINNESIDLDFRVESNNNASMLLVDAGNDAVVVGHTGSIASAGEAHELQVYDTNFSLISATTFRNGSDGATLSLGHSRSGTIGTQTVLNDADIMGAINFVGSDGTDFANIGAAIRGHVDGTPGANDMPGRLVFMTTADGSNSPTERLRINQKGSVGIGVADGDVTNDGTAARTYVGIIGSGNRGRLNLGTTASNGADAGTLAFTNGTNSLAELVVDTHSGVQNAGDLTIDVTGDITFDADGGDFNFKDGGTTLLSLSNAGSNNVQFLTGISDGDLLIKGVDGGSVITALSFDMSEAGIATFNSGINIGNRGSASDPTLQSAIDPDTGVFWGGSNILGFSSGGAERLRVSSEVVVNDPSNDVDFRVESNNKTNMLFVDAGNDCVVIGGTTVETADHFEVLGNDANTNLRIRNTNAGATGPRLIFDKSSDSQANDDDVGEFLFIGKDSAGNAEQFARFAVESSNVTSGAEDAAVNLSIMVNGTNTQIYNHSHVGTVFNDTSDSDLDFRVESDGNSNAIVVDAANDAVGIMTAAISGAALTVGGTCNATGYIFSNDTDTGVIRGDVNQLNLRAGGADRWVVTSSGVSTSGSLSKGSGSFKIDHPLPAKTDTHHLVHSFVEAPQADNIYRGSVDLVGGSATVNIDTAAGMTDGTFVLLNTNVQCFTSNESGWTAIKGSVSGNTLTITAQDNTCTDTISWMVVGERHDQHMKDTDWTDSDGKVIVEPEKT